MKRLELSYIQDIVRKLGHEPLFKKPVVNRDFVKCKCKIHGIFTVKVANLLYAYKHKKGNGCRKCGDMTKTNIQEVYDKFFELGLKPLFDKFERDTDDLPFICVKHPELGVQYTKYRTLKRGILRPCKKCSSENLSKKHTKEIKQKKLYDPRRRTSEYQQWKRFILKIFNKTCVRCGSTINPEAHHILPVVLFPDKILDINNGVVLCKKCHQKYHKKFSVKNTKINHLKEIFNFIKEIKFTPKWLIKNNIIGED